MRRNEVETVGASYDPHFGILSLGAFLALKDKYKLEVIGQVLRRLEAEQQYYVISKTAVDLHSCKGKTLATNLDDPKFIDKVIFKGDYKLADFSLISTTRPLQPLRKVISNEADCALVDSAQLAELGRMEGVLGTKSVWESDKLPAMVIVAFQAAPASEKNGFQKSLNDICDSSGADCQAAGITAFRPTSSATYAPIITAYDK